MENNFLSILTILIFCSSLMIIVTKNPIHSILFLVVVFVCSVGLFILLGTEFIGMLFLVVYVGAITVLFLFVIMMLNIKIIDLNERFIKYLPIGIFLILVFFFEIFFLINKNFSFNNISLTDNYFLNFKNYLNNIYLLVNTEQLALVLYSKYVYLFLLGGIILLIAMFGAIILTLNQKYKNKQQNFYLQTNQSVKSSIKHLN